MKSYSVFSLYVVKVKDEFFICQDTLKDNVYKEFFTKEKIIVENENAVESLSKYYSKLEIVNYETSEVLMLSKKEILHKYLEINNALEKQDLDNTNKRTGMDIMIEGWERYVSAKKANDEIPDIPIISVKDLKKKK